jgi:hypothetical protein
MTHLLPGIRVAFQPESPTREVAVPAAVDAVIFVLPPSASVQSTCSLSGIPQLWQNFIGFSISVILFCKYTN